MTVVNCNGITKGGTKCRARVIPGTDWCVFHSADAAQRKAWAAQGGANSSAQARAKKALPAEVMTIEEVTSWLGVVYRGVITKTIDPSVATAAANVARTMNELLRSQQIEERLASVETILGADRRAS